MLGKNLLLSQVVNPTHAPNATFLGVPLDSPFMGIPQLGMVGDIHVDTLVLAAVSMAIVLALVLAVSSSMVVEGAGSKGQQILEMLYDFMLGIAKNQIGDHKYQKFFPLIAGIFMFVLTANILGVGPWKALEPLFDNWGWKVQGEPFEVAAPTTDINCVLGLTIVSILAYLIGAVVVHRAKFFHMYFNPLNPHMYLEWLDLLIRPSTLTLRLMLVITADELLRAVALMLAPWLLPTGVMIFELCICLIQAFVFAILTSIYIGLTVQEHH